MRGGDRFRPRPSTAPACSRDQLPRPQRQPELDAVPRGAQVAAGQLLDAADPVAQRVAVAVQLARGALPLAVLLDERLERADQLVAVLAAPRPRAARGRCRSTARSASSSCSEQQQLEGAEVAVGGDVAGRAVGRPPPPRARSAPRGRSGAARSTGAARLAAALASVPRSPARRARRRRARPGRRRRRVDHRAQQIPAGGDQRAAPASRDGAVELGLAGRRVGRARRRAPRALGPTPNGAQARRRARLASSRPSSASASTSPARRRSVSRIARWRMSSSATTVAACWRSRRSKSPSAPASRTATSHACGPPRAPQHGQRQRAAGEVGVVGDERAAPGAPLAARRACDLSAHAPPRRPRPAGAGALRGADLAARVQHQRRAAYRAGQRANELVETALLEDQALEPLVDRDARAGGCRSAR